MAYEDVKRWQHKMKTRLVDALGGKCCKCGYDRCKEGLEFHHIDPTEKEFSISGWRVKNEQRLMNEVKKCVLLCGNCHRELHAGLFELTDDIIIPFDETKFLEKETKETKEIETDDCPVCGKLKNINQKHCSVECAGKSNRRIDWDSIDLKTMYEQFSVLEMSRQLGVSDVAIHKRLKSMGIKK